MCMFAWHKNVSLHNQLQRKSHVNTGLVDHSLANITTPTLLPLLLLLLLCIFIALLLFKVLLGASPFLLLLSLSLLPLHPLLPLMVSFHSLCPPYVRRPPLLYFHSVPSSLYLLLPSVLQLSPSLRLRIPPTLSPWYGRITLQEKSKLEPFFASSLLLYVLCVLLLFFFLSRDYL